MRCQPLTEWANILVEHECSSNMPRLWRWFVGLARATLDGVVDIVEGRWPVGRYDDDVAEDKAYELLRARGYLVLPPQLKALAEIRFLAELMPA